MTNKNITEEALLKQEQEKIVADLKEQGKMIGQAAVRTLIRTTTVHLIGRKVAPQIFSSFGRSYAVLLLVDMMKTKRIHTPPPVKKDVKGENTTVNVHMPDAFDQPSLNPLKTTSFRTEAPKETKGYTKGDRWFVMGGKDATGSSKAAELHIFDGTHWVRHPYSENAV